MQSRSHPSYVNLTKALERAGVPQPGNTAGTLLRLFGLDGKPVLLTIDSFAGRKVEAGRSFYKALMDQLIAEGYLIRNQTEGRGWEHSLFMVGPRLHKYLAPKKSKVITARDIYKGTDWESSPVE